MPTPIFLLSNQINFFVPILTARSFKLTNFICIFFSFIMALHSTWAYFKQVITSVITSLLHHFNWNPNDCIVQSNSAASGDEKPKILSIYVNVISSNLWPKYSIKFLRLCFELPRSASASFVFHYLCTDLLSWNYVSKSSFFMYTQLFPNSRFPFQLRVSSFCFA